MFCFLITEKMPPRHFVEVTIGCQVSVVPGLSVSINSLFNRRNGINQQQSVICNYQFICERIEGVKAKWIINLVDHFHLPNAAAAVKDEGRIPQLMSSPLKRISGDISNHKNMTCNLEDFTPEDAFLFMQKAKFIETILFISKELSYGYTNRYRLINYLVYCPF